MEQTMSSTLTLAEAGGYGRVGGIDFSGRKTTTPCWSDRAARRHTFEQAAPLTFGIVNEE